MWLVVCGIIAVIVLAACRCCVCYLLRTYHSSSLIIVFVHTYIHTYIHTFKDRKSIKNSPIHIYTHLYTYICIDVNRNIRRLRPNLNMVHWNSDGFKVGKFKKTNKQKKNQTNKQTKSILRRLIKIFNVFLLYHCDTTDWIHSKLASFHTALLTLAHWQQYVYGVCQESGERERKKVSEKERKRVRLRE